MHTMADIYELEPEMPTPDLPGTVVMRPSYSEAADALAAHPFVVERYERTMEVFTRHLRHAIDNGEIPAMDDDTVRERLTEVPGIGPWTAGYARLRGESDPDVWLAGDAVIRRVLSPPSLAGGDSDIGIDVNINFNLMIGVDKVAST